MIIQETISLDEVRALAEAMYGDMTKAVADVDKGLLAIDAELHSDLETELLKEGSAQESLWGFNIYPEMYGDEDCIEYDSLINIRPRQGNRGRGVDNPEIRQKIVDIVNKHIIA